MLSQKLIATGPEALTKPLLRPPLQDRCEAFQSWPGCPSSWQGEDIGRASTWWPLASRLTLTGWPCLSVKPSTSARPGTWNGTMPSRLSKEWFSIMSTTTCSIWGMLSAPGRRSGNGRLSGRRTPAVAAIGLAQAGRPLYAERGGAPAAAPKSERRVRVDGRGVGWCCGGIARDVYRSRRSGASSGPRRSRLGHDAPRAGSRDERGNVAGMTDDRRPPGNHLLLSATRVWLPTAIAVAGVVLDGDRARQLLQPGQHALAGVRRRACPCCWWP